MKNIFFISALLLSLLHVNTKASPPKLKQPQGNGLPVTESFSSKEGFKYFATQYIKFVENDPLTMVATLFTAEKGKKLVPPQASLSFVPKSREGIWKGVKEIEIFYKSKRLNLAAYKQTNWTEAGAEELIAAEIPLGYFAEIAKQPQFHIRIGRTFFTVKSPQMAGMRALASKIPKKYVLG